MALAELILELLTERGLLVDSASAAWIRECEDLQALQCWARHAGEVETIAELFDRA